MKKSNRSSLAKSMNNLEMGNNKWIIIRQIAGDYLRGKAKLLREGGSGHGGVAEWGEVAQHINSRAQMAYIGKKTVISV